MAVFYLCFVLAVQGVALITFSFDTFDNFYMVILGLFESESEPQSESESQFESESESGGI